MNRRDFLRRSATVVPFAVAAVVGPQGYQRTQPKAGYLHAKDVGGQVERVTVDGVEVTRVFELDDVEGWVRRYGRFGDAEGFPVERIEGEVEVFWRPQEAR